MRRSTHGKNKSILFGDSMNHPNFMREERKSEKHFKNSSVKCITIIATALKY